MLQKLLREGSLKGALRLIERVVQRTPTEEAPKGAYVSLLKECARRKMLMEGKRVHALIIRSKCDSNIFLANNLIAMYSKCGSVPEARSVFNAMPWHNVVSWTAIISAYTDGGEPEEAIHLYQEMHKAAAVAPDKVVFLVVLKACARAAALEQGKRIHSLILEKGFLPDLILQNALVDMYAKCGCLRNARETFNNMSKRDVVSWNAMISGYTQNGLGTEAIALYRRMGEEGTRADKVTFVCVLKACASIRALEQGRQIHTLMLEKGIHLDVIAQSALVDMYAKCGCLGDACDVFKNMSTRNVVSWNALISGCAQNGLGMETIALYEQMEKEGIQADEVTYACVLKACANVRALEQGKRIHSLILEKGFHLNAVIQVSLIDMYAKCGFPEHARDMFDNMTQRDVASWNAMIAGYAQNGLGMKAIALYEQMVAEGVHADKVTFVCVVKACADIGALRQGKRIHSHILAKGFHLDMIMQSALVDMYAKCRCLEAAREVFNNMSDRDVVSWNAMIAGYAQNGPGMEAIALYAQMKDEGVLADELTFVSILKACAKTGALEQGREIHALITEKGIDLHTIVQSALVDMYAKCGCLEDAYVVFNNMSGRDVISWTAMIAGHAQKGLGTQAIALYEQMREEGIQPNHITYVCVLSACSHAGLVKEGFRVFDFMCKYCGVLPTVEHYACMVDLLGRAGLLAEANELIMKMPVQPTLAVWMSLLGAARNARNAEMGQNAFDHIVKLDPENAAPFLLLTDIYACLGWMDKVAEMRNKGLENKTWMHLD